MVCVCVCGWVGGVCVCVCVCVECSINTKGAANSLPVLHK